MSDKDKPQVHKSWRLGLFLQENPNHTLDDLLKSGKVIQVPGWWCQRWTDSHPSLPIDIIEVSVFALESEKTELESLFRDPGKYFYDTVFPKDQ